MQQHTLSTSVVPMTGVERFLAACHHEQPDATPVWFMRQAGRCLAEYRELRKRYDILTMAKTPELCTQVTLMPVEQFGVDGAVLYADIMLPLEGMGISLEIQPDLGPIIHNPIRTMQDVDALRIIDPEESTSFVMEAIRMVRRELAGKKAVIGFSGAPFTLACYMIEGRPSRDYGLAKSLMYGQPQVWHALMNKLTEVVSRYLLAQFEQERMWCRYSIAGLVRSVPAPTNNLCNHTASVSSRLLSKAVRRPSISVQEPPIFWS